MFYWCGIESIIRFQCATCVLLLCNCTQLVGHFRNMRDNFYTLRGGTLERCSLSRRATSCSSCVTVRTSDRKFYRSVWSGCLRTTFENFDSFAFIYNRFSQRIPGSSFSYIGFLLLLLLCSVVLYYFYFKSSVTRCGTAAAVVKTPNK